MSSHDAAPRSGVTGQFVTAGRPHGFSSLTPFLVVPGARRALDFYRDVFGAEVGGVSEMPGPDGDLIVVHAELQFADGRLQLGDPNPAYGLVPPPSADGQVCYSMGLYVQDVDGTVAAARARGATVREEPTEFVSGDRFASILDPWGIRWSVMTRVEDLSPEESDRRVAEWVAAQG